DRPEGRRLLLALRAPHPAVLRPGARGLSARREDRRHQQAGAVGRGLRASPAGAGADDVPDRADDLRAAGAPRGGRGAGSRAPLHADARCGEAELDRRHECDAGGLPRSAGDARRVHEPDRRTVRSTGLAAQAVELLGPVTGPVAITCGRRPRLAAALAARLVPLTDGRLPVGAIVAFLGEPARPPERQALLRDLRARLAPGTLLVLLDHNQPRARW